MRIKQNILYLAISVVPMVVYASTFQVINNSSKKGIYVLFTSPSSPSLITSISGANGSSLTCSTDKAAVFGVTNPYCCVFIDHNNKKVNQATFTVEKANPGFNIAAGRCGSSGSAQAEFTVGSNSKDDCWKSSPPCDIVNASLVSGHKYDVKIQSNDSSAHAINTAEKSSCAVQTKTSQGACAQQRPKGKPALPGSQCKQTNNYCTNFYKSGGKYTVTFS